MAVRPRLESPGLVLPSGALSKPLIDFLAALQSGGDTTALTAALSALGLRVSAIEAQDGVQITGQEPITVAGSAEAGYVISSSGNPILAAQIFGS